MSLHAKLLPHKLKTIQVFKTCSITLTINANYRIINLYQISHGSVVLLYVWLLMKLWLWSTFSYSTSAYIGEGENNRFYQYTVFTFISICYFTTKEDAILNASLIVSSFHACTSDNCPVQAWRYIRTLWLRICL